LIRWIRSSESVEVQVGFGALGINGGLGYENKKVVVGPALLARSQHHPPARLRFQLDGRHNTFRCHVAINDDVQAGLSADFTVLVDGEDRGLRPAHPRRR
jgi:hypothetical protein